MALTGRAFALRVNLAAIVRFPGYTEVVPEDDLTRLLSRLDAETRARWGLYLAEIEAEVAAKGPEAVREHLEAALRHLLAVGWAAHRCYDEAEAGAVLTPVGEAAQAVENARLTLAGIARKPQFDQ